MNSALEYQLIATKRHKLLKETVVLRLLCRFVANSLPNASTTLRTTQYLYLEVLLRA